MIFAVVYYSRGGNTRKLAETIAGELSCIPVDVKIESPDVTNADLLVVGSGTYASKPGKEIMTFLENLSPVNQKKAACFSSCMRDAKKTLATMQEILNERGYSISDCFSCYGELASIVKRGHPTKEELDQAKEFARKLKNK